MDVTLSLEKGLFWPFSKPNNIILYVNINSNHPKTVTNQIPKGVQKRLSCLSANKDLFNSHKGPFQDALNKAGFKFNLEFEENEENGENSSRKNRKRNITWFNPPFFACSQDKFGEMFPTNLEQS